jgi:hypothetical protein
MIEENQGNHSKHPFRKKILRGITFVFLGLLFLEFIIYFGSNIILSNWARRKINEATKEVYVIEFNRVNFSLFRRGVFFSGINLRPVEGHQGSSDQVLFELSLNEIALKKLWYSFSDNILYVGNLEFDNPNLRMDMPELKSDARPIRKDQAISPVKALEIELKKSIDSFRFTGVFIDQIEINHADLFFLNFLSNKSIQAENSKVLIKDLDWTSKDDWETPFNARGFEFDLENVSLPLPDGVHSVHAQKVFVSSLENIIDLHEFTLSSDKNQPSEAYYDMHLRDLRVGNVELNEAFKTSNVNIDEVVLNEPDFKVLEKVREEKYGASGDLNNLIQGLLKRFEIQELSVNDGKFVSSDFADTLKNRIEIKNFDFKMIDFYLGADSLKRENQFFYGEDAAMDIKDAKLYLSDNVHVISGEMVRVSSFTNEIIVENVKVEPREDALKEKQPENILRISLPKLTLNEANLKKLYNEGKLQIDEMNVNFPKVEVTELRSVEKSRPDGGSGKELSVKDLLEGFVDEIAIQKFDLRDGEVQFKNEEGVRSDDLAFERFSVQLEDVLIQPTGEFNVRDQLLAQNMVLSLDKYRLKLRDNLHEFSADKVLIDSKNSRVVVDNFTLRPENLDSIHHALDAYDKSIVLDISIPKFRMEGIDLMAAYMDEKLIIHQILVPSPVARMTRYRKNNKDPDILQIDSTPEIEDLLTSYFSYIDIDSVNFSNGQVSYKNFAGAKEISLSEDSLSLSLKGFHLERGQSPDPERTFFSDEIDLALRKYNFSVAGGDYDVDTDGISFNSKSKTITIDNLRLTPSNSISKKIELSLNLPSVRLLGVDLEFFLFDNSLNLDKLIVDGSSINLDINSDFHRDSLDSLKNDINITTLPKSIGKVAISTIQANNSSLKLNYRTGKDGMESIQTDFDLAIKGLNLDSATNARKDIAGLFQEINLTLEDFSYNLPDSIHSINFSSVYVNNTSDETIFSNFEILPNSLKGHVGTPIVALKVDELGIKNNTLREMQLTGVLNLTQLRISKPDLILYIDDKKFLSGSSNKPKIPSNNRLGLIQSVLLQDVKLEHGTIAIQSKQDGQLPHLKFKDVNLTLDDLNFDLINQGSLKPEFLLNKELGLSISNYTFYDSDSLNLFKIGKISLSQSQLTLDKVSYGPISGKYHYLRKLGYQADALSGFVEKIEVKDFDFKAYLEENRLKAHSILFQGMDLAVFRDKRIPLKEGIIKDMPQELMQKSPINVEIDSLIFVDGNVQYQEFLPRSMLPGTISFEALTGSIAPFILIKKQEEYPVSNVVVNAKTNVMGTGATHLIANMFFNKPYPMDVDVKMGEFDLRLTNNLLSHGSFIRILDGKVIDGKWNFRLNEEEAWGKMTFKYEDLKVEFLDPLTLERGRGQLGFMTFLANTFTKKSNPRTLFNRKVTSRIYYERDKSKFVFGTWWRASFSGLKGSVGLGQPKGRKKEE